MISLQDETIHTLQSGSWLLFYYTDWCPLCPKLKELLEAMEQTKPPFSIAQIDFEQCPRSVQIYGVVGVPTVLALSNGALLEALPGMRPAEQYNALAARLAAPA
ncbi:MAG: thioredoxin family protein [Oscillospiraceae bacterium]|jgi:thioredoxin-like negative regulator of GroEL|nr:thioredoxin family protein [Oscillospiraceae bacterium]